MAEKESKNEQCKKNDRKKVNKKSNMYRAKSEAQFKVDDKEVHFRSTIIDEKE